MENNKGTRISLLIKEINGLMKQSIKQMFDETGLTTPQIMVLATLSKYGSMRISELSEKLSLSNSTISGIVDRLENQGYVERVRSRKDRRVVHVSFSEKCRRMMHGDFHRIIEQNLEKKLAGADPGQIDDILKGLETLKSLLELN
ncbi:MarR family winged helix-turn-helix transcriptional regulator [Fonticella tunisiensis]|uniref:MarR family transcriptional regulator n=1 Tax=Fonticella tunisiensis TaxID=1096341 RepID=A0A4R7KT60_9CLOT|nr:MarR family transcriptional regulator [Fonticella tunisiensis]TDT63267.1 MarR family transcriptional regulator [Fonticella tunisiensis]